MRIKKVESYNFQYSRSRWFFTLESIFKIFLASILILRKLSMAFKKYGWSTDKKLYANFKFHLNQIKKKEF